MLHVAVQTRDELTAQTDEELRTRLDHAAAHALFVAAPSPEPRYAGAGRVHERPCARPHRPAPTELRGSACARGNGRSGRESLHAIAMKGCTRPARCHRRDGPLGCGRARDAKIHVREHRAQTIRRPRRCRRSHRRSPRAPCAAPQRPSARAAPFTSVSNPTGTDRCASRGTIGVSRQPGLGVDVIHP